MTLGGRYLIAVVGKTLFSHFTCGWYRGFGIRDLVKMGMFMKLMYGRLEGGA